MIRYLLIVMTLVSAFDRAEGFYSATAESEGLRFDLVVDERTPTKVVYGTELSGQSQELMLEIKIFVFNYSNHDVQFPLGINNPTKGFTTRDRILRYRLAMSVSEYDLPWAEDVVSVKPSVATVDATSLRPGGAALIDVLQVYYEEEDPFVGIRVDLFVDEDLRMYYPVWTGRVSLEVDLTQDEVEDLCEQ